MDEIFDQLLGYLRGMWSHRWFGLGFAWLVCATGWTGVYLIPNSYEASATFYVDASSRLREVVQKLGMEPNVSSRVFLVRQAMMGRPQLEKVARQTDLDIAVTSPIDLEELLDSLQEKIHINTGNRREAKNLFNLSFQHQDRQVAERVVTALLNAFLDDILNEKNSDTERTQEFLEEQLGYYRSLLESTEQKLQIFKKDHAGFVVGDRGDYFARMQTEEENVLELTGSRQVEVSKRNELRRQLASVNPYAPVEDNQNLSTLIPGNESSRRLAETKRTRRELLLRVTEIHPDVIALDEQIASLKEQLDKELRLAADSVGEDGASSSTNPVYIEIQIALSNSNLKLAEVDGELQQVSAKLERLRAEVDNAPYLERQFLQLTRDYANYQGLYNEVLDQTERERIGRVGEEKDVISFNIIEPPRAGSEPVSPNRPLLLLATLVFGLGAGAALSLFLWMLKPTVRNVVGLRGLVPFPVIGNLSLNMTQTRRSHALSLYIFAGAGSLLVGAFVFALAIQADASLWLREAVEGFLV